MSQGRGILFVTSTIQEESSSCLPSSRKSNSRDNPASPGWEPGGLDEAGWGILGGMLDGHSWSIGQEVHSHTWDGVGLTFALAADPHVPAAVLDVDPAVHVPLRLIVVVNQAAVQVEDKPVPLPAAQDGACWDREQCRTPASLVGSQCAHRTRPHPLNLDSSSSGELLHPTGHLGLAPAPGAA